MKHFPKSIIYKLVHHKRKQLKDWFWDRIECPKRDAWILETEEKLKEIYPHLWDWYEGVIYDAWPLNRGDPPEKPINII